MARIVRDLPNERASAALAVLNQLTYALGAFGALPHYHCSRDANGDPADAVQTADASSLSTSQELARSLALAIEAHGADTEAHSGADAIAIAAWASRPAVPVNLAEVQAVLNEVKADFNTHILLAARHRAVGGAGKLAQAAAIATADASDQTTANTLANAIKVALNAHARGGAQTTVVVPS